MSKKAIYAEDLLCAIRDDPDINGTNFARVREHIEAATELDAVEVVRCKECIYITKKVLVCSVHLLTHITAQIISVQTEKGERDNDL